MNRKILLRILDRARWAPSGDNTQPWRFQTVNDERVIVHAYDTRDDVLYDFDGHASHMAHGALLETMRLAASAEGMSMTVETRTDSEWRQVEYDIRFEASPRNETDPLHTFIEKRTVQRRPMATKPLSGLQREALQRAAGDNFVIQFFETQPQKQAIAALLWSSAYIRLTCPEAFPVHQSVIEWGARFSKDRIPEQAVGVDPVTARLMKWVMQSWGRVDFFNRYLMGTIVPRIQLDYFPALFCAAHFLIKPKATPSSLQDWNDAGRALQRVWLTATQLGLHLQPEMTPLIFRWYAREGHRFSSQEELGLRAEVLAQDFERIVSADKSDAFGFFARIGYSSTPASRSLRIDLDELLQQRAEKR